MTPVSFGGLGNGIDFGQVINQLMRVARLPVDRLAGQRTALNSTSTDYATLNTKLISLQSAADRLRLPTSFDRISTSVSNETVLTATGSSTATPGTYQVQVNQLAQSHQVISRAGRSVPTTTTDIVPGTSATFTFRVGTDPDQTVTLDATGTLENLRDRINDRGAGVAASIINTGTPTTPAFRLVLTSTATGSANTITVSADNTTLDLTNASGTGGTDILQAAQDAVVVVGSATTVTLTRSSNVVTDAISGVTLTLRGLGTVRVNVAHDAGAVQSNITALATAYNDVVRFINERTTYDVTTKRGGVFANEPTVRNVLSQLRTALSSAVPGASTPSSVGEIGFMTERNGTITVDGARLSSALTSNYGGVRTLFITQTGITGVAQRLTDAVNSLGDVRFGSVALRRSSLTREITRLGDDIARREAALALHEERLRRQYAALDGLLRQLQTQSGFLLANSSARNPNRLQ